MSNIYNTYIVFNKLRNKIYIGYTSDLLKRIARHNNLLPNKKTSYTSKNKGTWMPIYIEEFSSLLECKKREKWLKSGQGRFFIQQNLKQWIKKAQLVDPPKADF